MTSQDGAPRFIRGVPHELPEGERVLWQGAPDARAVAVHVFHRRLLLAYFAAMLALWAVPTWSRVPSDVFLSQGATLGLVVAFVLVLAELLARVVARTSWYAITNRRVVLRIGMVLPMSINIPFTILESAGVGLFKDGTGQVVLKLVKGQRIAYIALWPHCRPFAINQPEPVLRGLVNAREVGAILARAVAEAGSSPVALADDRPAAAPAAVPEPAGI
jgi:hypothetical protein